MIAQGSACPYSSSTQTSDHDFILDTDKPQSSSVLTYRRTEPSHCSDDLYVNTVGRHGFNDVPENPVPFFRSNARSIMWRLPGGNRVLVHEDTRRRHQHLGIHERTFIAFAICQTSPSENLHGIASRGLVEVRRSHVVSLHRTGTTDPSGMTTW